MLGAMGEKDANMGRYPQKAMLGLVAWPCFVLAGWCLGVLSVITHGQPLGAPRLGTIGRRLCIKQAQRAWRFVGTWVTIEKGA